MNGIETITIEIKRLKAEAQRCLKEFPNESIVWVQQMTVCDKLLSFIDSMQKNPIPKFKVGQFIVPKKHTEEPLEITKIEDGRYYDRDLHICDIREQDQWELVEEPVSDDLEAEIDRCILDEDMNFDACARHFANWQREQDKQWLAENHKHIFAQGRESMREQMMKDAVDGTVFAKLNNGEIMVRSGYFKSDWLNYLDIVKLIIIKDC